MTKISYEVPDDLLAQVRKLLPKAAMPYGQARINAEQIALRLRKILGSADTRLSLDFIEQIPGVTVTMLAASKMERLTKSPGTSGATAVREDGTYGIYIQDNNSVTHCRFTLAHELFHVITAPFYSVSFGDFGHGDHDLHRRRIERLADHFAANLLVPRTMLKREWALGIQGVRELAADFAVSEEAMRIRLRTVGLVRSVTKEMFYRQPRRRLSLFFRQAAPPAATPDDPRRNAYAEVQGCPGAILTVDEACERLRISKWTLYKLIHEQRLTTFKLGARRLVPEAALWAVVNRLSAEEAT